MIAIQMTETEAKEIYPTASPKLKARLERGFGGRQFFAAVTPMAFESFKGTIDEWEAYIIPRVNSFEDACAEIGEDPADSKFNEGTPDEIAYKCGKLVVRVLNGPFVLSFKKPDQKKWQSWIDYTPSGFRFQHSFCDHSYTNTPSGSRLRLCSDRLSEHFAIKFGGVMNPFWDFDN